MNHYNHRVSSIEYRESSYLRAYKALHLSRTLYKSALFMQNKPNLVRRRRIANVFCTMTYENKCNWTLGQNKPNSNPIKPNLPECKIDAKCVFTKDYERNDIFAVRNNKPNSNSISVKPKMSANSLFTKDYENETAFRLPKNKPKQTQFQRQKMFLFHCETNMRHKKFSRNC